MKNIAFLIVLLSIGFTQCNSTKKDTSVLALSKTETIVDIATPNEVESADQKIQVALLLDTSNSMDGLIEQAKSRLWEIVNTLTTLKYGGKEPNIEIALYEYGNDGLSSSENWIRKVTPLTQDLDLISEKLFALRTNGGSEYCGAVIGNAVKELDWDSNENSMKLVYIAGNEGFDQGQISYKESISDSRNKNIFVNTIFCGNRAEGINTFWKDGADIGKGKYFHIDSNKKVVYIATPYDDQIDRCNTRLNATYIGYGSLGRSKIRAQAAQDASAEEVAYENKINRAVSKSKKNAYFNDSWDLVDKVEQDSLFLDKVKEEQLPEELKGLSKKEQKEFVTKKANERSEIQKEIARLAKKRQEFINQEMKNRGGESQDDLGAAIKKSILELAETMGYKQES